MSALEEVQAAVAGARDAGLPVAVTMSFDTNFHTMMGIKPAQAVSTLAGWGVGLIGANCGNGPAEIERIMTEQIKPATFRVTLPRPVTDEEAKDVSVAFEGDARMVQVHGWTLSRDQDGAVFLDIPAIMPQGATIHIEIDPEFIRQATTCVRQQRERQFFDSGRCVMPCLVNIHGICADADDFGIQLFKVSIQRA
jgi:hypothetical protein